MLTSRAARFTMASAARDQIGTRGPAASSSVFTRLSELHAELARAYAELAQQDPVPTGPEQRPDEVLRIREACRRKGWTYSWAVKHWKALGGFKDVDGKLKISLERLAHRPFDLR
jgi:hypothetical protein